MSRTAASRLRLGGRSRYAFFGPRVESLEDRLYPGNLLGLPEALWWDLISPASAPIFRQ